MEKAGIIGSTLYTFNDYQWLHGIFAGISVPIIVSLLLCHTYNFCVNYRLYKLNENITLSEVSPPAPSPPAPSPSGIVSPQSIKSPRNDTCLTVKTKHCARQSKLDFPKKNTDNLLMNQAYYYIWIMHILVLITLVLGFIDSIFSIISYFHINILNIISNNCQLLTRIITISWSFSKNFLGFISLFRVLACFKNSAFEYNKILTNILLGYFVLVNIGTQIAIFYFGNGTTIYNNSKQYYWCQYSVQIQFVPIIGILDITVNVILLLMFVRPLMKISKMVNNKDEDIIGLIVKYFILVMIGILSTSIFYISLLFGLGSLQILDVGVNLCCVILMSPLHKKYYDIFCKICHNKLLQFCMTKNDTNKSDSLPV